MNPKISVIVPVYNAEKYLRECIDSILAQTFTDFELVLVDDGSPDNCGAICDEYAAKHDNVRVFHQTNQGINKTRRNGVMNAKGEWVVFSDDDDSLTPDALESLYSLSDGTDLVIGFPDTPKQGSQLSMDEFKSSAITAKKFPPCPWAKLYRRSLFNDNTFDFPREIDGEEDMIMNIRIMFKNSTPPRILYKKIYNFRRNTASVSHTKRASLQHEYLFDKVRRESISEEDFTRFIHEINWSRFNGLYPVAYADPYSLIKDEPGYIAAIKADMRKYKCRISLRDRILLHCKNARILKAIGFSELVRRSLKYRLGLNRH